MKLHETSLLGYARLPAAPDRQGQLCKKSLRSGTYQRRWCELRGNLLFYWERRGDREPLGLILLEGCTVELRESASEPFTFEISCPLGHRTYKLAAEDQASMEGWVRALSTASFAYLRALLTELEGQYRTSGALGAALPQEGAACPGPVVIEVGLPDFEGLHQQFGEEIVKLRARWRETRGEGVQPVLGDLIDLG
ncbi:sesquipedalian-1-like [Carettochelys insculpta]|uniref:sesquipedalian-1-like n=1 Tax=Carettochelys insculpta TaxID=44489 RepID=UPI003EB83544